VEPTAPSALESSGALARAVGWVAKQVLHGSARRLTLAVSWLIVFLEGCVFHPFGLGTFVV